MDRHLKKLQNFKSLGTLISSKNARDDEIKSRIVVYNKKFYSLEQIFISISMSKEVDNNNNNHHHY